MFRSSLLLVGAALLLGLGCTVNESEACGKGTVYVDGVCQTASGGQAGSGAAPASGADAGGAPEAGSNAGGADSAPESNFGAACAEHSDCTGDTDYCAASPFSDAYCTAKGCDDDASICPQGWSCFNVDNVNPGMGEPWVCSQPL